jgi:hypothetical protein
MSDTAQKSQIEEFLGREFGFVFSAGECNFLIQLLAHLVQENPPLAVGKKGEKEALNYQSIRTIVLLNDKLSAQLQNHAREASIVIGDVKVKSERVQ